MIKALQNLGPVGSSQPTPGWYYNSIYGWVYVDEHGVMYSGNRYTGLIYGPLGFTSWAVHPATNIRSDAPITAIEGDTIQVTFGFEYKGRAQTLKFQIGNCAATLIPNVWDRAGENWIEKSVSQSSDWVSYEVTGTFVHTELGAPGSAPHLFILPRGESYDVPELDIVYTNAFTWLEADFRDMEITSYGGSA